MFGWMQKLIDAVPEVWSPTLEPARPNETVLGKLPGDIWKAWLGAVYGTEEAARLKSEATRKAMEHAEAHERGDEEADGGCAAARDEYQRLMRDSEALAVRARVLHYAVAEAISDHFGNVGEGTLDVRIEGIVLVPKPSNPLAEFLEALGDRVQVLDLTGDGDEGFFDLGRSRRGRRGNGRPGGELGDILADLRSAAGPKR